jgi:hypothetical protein
LKPKFEQWYNKSIVSSKKDKARSVEADNIKLKKSQADFAKTLAKLEVITENQKLGWLKTDQPKHYNPQPNRPKPTVADTAKKEQRKQQQRKKCCCKGFFP